MHISNFTFAKKYFIIIVVFFSILFSTRDFKFSELLDFKTFKSYFISNLNVLSSGCEISGQKNLRLATRRERK